MRFFISNIFLIICVLCDGQFSLLMRPRISYESRFAIIVDNSDGENVTKFQHFMTTYNIPINWAVTTHYVPTFWGSRFAPWIAAGGELLGHNPQGEAYNTVTASEWDSLVHVCYDTLNKYQGYATWFVYPNAPGDHYFGDIGDKEQSTRSYWDYSINTQGNVLSSIFNKLPILGFRTMRGTFQFPDSPVSLQDFKDKAREHQSENKLIIMTTHHNELLTDDSIYLCRVIEFIKDTLDMKIVKMSEISAMGSLGEDVETKLTIQSVQPADINQVGIKLGLMAGAEIYVDWGDDNITELNGGKYGSSDTTITSDYSAGSTIYDIDIYGHLSGIYKFEITSEPTITGSINEFNKLDNLEWLDLQLLATTWTGTIDSLPDYVKYLALRALGDGVGGSIDNITSQYFYHLYLNTLSDIDGDIDDMTTNELTYFYALATPNITGTINNKFGDLTDLSISYNDNITGDISNINQDLAGVLSLVEVDQLTGDINDLSKSVTSLYLNGISGIYGSINDLSEDINSLLIRDCGEIIGSIDNLSFVDTYLYLRNESEITGNISSLSTSLETMYFISMPGVDITTGIMPAWENANMYLQGAFSSVEVDGFLNAYASPAGTGTASINLAGDNEARTAASDAAVATLEGKNKTVTTN